MACCCWTLLTTAMTPQRDLGEQRIYKEGRKKESRACVSSDAVHGQAGKQFALLAGALSNTGLLELGRCFARLHLLFTWVERTCVQPVLIPVCCVHSFPSSLPALMTLTRSATAVSDTSGNAPTASTSAVVSPPPLPVLTVGLGKNGDCIPAQGNYRRFHEAAAAGGGAPAALVVLSEVRLLVSNNKKLFVIDRASVDSLQGQLCLIRIHSMPLLGECLSVIPLHLQAGHFQVLDKLTFLQESACYAGRVRHDTAHHALKPCLMPCWRSTLQLPFCCDVRTTAAYASLPPLHLMAAGQRDQS